MIKIAHRGNVHGQDRRLENTTEYVQKALDKGYLAEVDIWLVDTKWYMTHDEVINKDTEISYKWLLQRSDKLIIHCKNVEALIYFNHHEEFHYFWHQEDDYTLTNLNWIWAYPGKPLPLAVGNMSVCVMPEWHGMNADYIKEFKAVCSDYVGDIEID